MGGYNSSWYKHFTVRMFCSERPIVRVEATVMIRGEDGFTPHLGYGNSRIAIYESLTRTEYLLYAYKIQDKKVSQINKLCISVLIPLFRLAVLSRAELVLKTQKCLKKPLKFVTSCSNLNN